MKLVFTSFTFKNYGKWHSQTHKKDTLENPRVSIVEK